MVGRATVEVAPDFVTVRRRADPRPAPTAALDQNSASAKKIIDFAKGFGVAERDIQTDAVNLSQLYKTVRDPGGNTRQEPDGYQAMNAVRVTLRDLTRLGTFMRDVLDKGATNIGGVTFGMADSEKSGNEARTKAVENAVRQAQGLADAAKVKLGRIVEIIYPASAAGPADGAADLPCAPRRRRKWRCWSRPARSRSLPMSRWSGRSNKTKIRVKLHRPMSPKPLISLYYLVVPFPGPMGGPVNPGNPKLASRGHPVKIVTVAACASSTPMAVLLAQTAAGQADGRLVGVSAIRN